MIDTVITWVNPKPELHRSGCGKPRPRCTEGTQPDRITSMRNMATPMGSVGSGSRRTVRDAQFPSGRRRIQEAKAVQTIRPDRPRHRETGRVPDNLPDRAMLMGIPAPKGG